MIKKEYFQYLVFITLIISILFIFSVLNVTAIEYPKLTGFITDNAGIIDSEAEATLAEIVQEIEQSTTAEIAIVTIKTLDGEPIEDYAVKLFEKSGIGKKDVDNGVLILVAVDDRKYRIEVGYGLEGVLTDVQAMQIGNKIMTPYFKQGLYSDGLYQVMLEIQGFIKSDPEITSKYASKNQDSSLLNLFLRNRFFWFLVIFFIISIISSSLGKKKNSSTFIPIFIPGFGGGFSGRGGHGGGFGGGFGGFGGGMSGGGGFSGGW